MIIKFSNSVTFSVVSDLHYTELSGEGASLCSKDSLIPEHQKNAQNVSTHDAPMAHTYVSTHDAPMAHTYVTADRHIMDGGGGQSTDQLFCGFF